MSETEFRAQALGHYGDRRYMSVEDIVPLGKKNVCVCVCVCVSPHTSQFHTDSKSRIKSKRLMFLSRKIVKDFKERENNDYWVSYLGCLLVFTSTFHHL